MLTEKRQIHEEWYQRLQVDLTLNDPKQKQTMLEIVATIDDFFDTNSLESHIDYLQCMLSGSIENREWDMSKKHVFDAVSQTAVTVNFLIKLSGRLSVLKAL